MRDSINESLICVLEFTMILNYGRDRAFIKGVMSLVMEF